MHFTFKSGTLFFIVIPKKVLQKLKKLTLVSTKITVIPKEIFQLPSLVYLNLKNNRLKSLPELEERSSLKELILGRNYLNEVVLENFFNEIPNLHYLDLGQKLKRLKE